jgi:hypothetical protein
LHEDIASKRNDVAKTIAKEEEDIKEVKQKVLAHEKDQRLFGNAMEKFKETFSSIWDAIFSPYTIIVVVVVLIVVGFIGLKCARAGLLGPQAQVAALTCCCCC